MPERPRAEDTTYCPPDETPRTIEHESMTIKSRGTITINQIGATCPMNRPEPARTDSSVKKESE